MNKITESDIESFALDTFTALGYTYVYGKTIAPGETAGERNSFSDVVLTCRLKDALCRINPDMPASAIDEAVRQVLTTKSPNLFENNYRFHILLVSGIDVEYRKKDGSTVYDKVWLIDYENPDNNDWLVVNQFDVIEDRNHKIPDIIVFINGLPITIFELKNPLDENATVKKAYQQILTYKTTIPVLFQYNELVVISDGIEARIGTIAANFERFSPWRTIEGADIKEKHVLELEILIKGIFDKKRFLDLIQNFIVHENTGKNIIKKIAGYHQYYAVNKAVGCTLQASSAKGDKRIGVIWHTQGSGKSLLMVFYAGKIIKHKGMDNPTIVILTDRNDLDDQLFNTFSLSTDLLRQTPKQAESQLHLKELLKVASGGVIFTTMQKFMPETKGGEYPLLSERRNIVLIADEAHRGQYNFIDGSARHIRDALPNASFIGFTGTPLELSDKSTPAVFGDYIDIFDIQRSVEDGFTVKIYYEGRLAKLELKEQFKPQLDDEFEEITENEELEHREKLKTKWSRLEAMVGSPERIKSIAKDIVEHFEQRLEVIKGKGMIVCMSRRICVELYNEIIKLRPDWHNKDINKGFIKVVMTMSSSDPVEWQLHNLGKLQKKAIEKRFKDDKDEMKLVIVRDMWLTGFDVPHLHTMYIDKPMKGHGLMQAIARVNRVYKDKEGGLIVDYLGIAAFLKRALMDYTEKDRGNTGIPQDVAVDIMKEKYEIIKTILHGFNYQPYFKLAIKDALQFLMSAQEYILAQEDGKKRYLKAVSELSKAFALAVPHDSTKEVRDDLRFFQELRALITKLTVSETKSEEELDSAINQLISNAVSSNEIVDIFSAMGLKTPDISILSDEFLDGIKKLPQKNLALELLRKLINDELKVRSKKYLVQSRSFVELLEKTIIQYHNRAIDAAKVIEELINLAKEMREAQKRGEILGLTEDEVAFYDALEINDSAVKILGDEALKNIAHDLVETIRKNTAIDWTVKESVKAKLRVMVKRILKKYGYPPDKQEKATLTVLEQAELLCKDWAE